MRNWISGRDIPRLVALSIGYLGTALVPRSQDRRIATILSTLALRFRRAHTLRVAEVLERRLGIHLDGRDPLQIAEDHARMRIEDGWGRLRALHRQGWAPSIEVDGIEHVRRAVDQGQGVVLWTTWFCGAIIPKAALASTGFPVNHLSREEHGAPSRSRLALAVIAPFYARAEVGYLKRRIVIPLNQSLGYMKELLALLKAGECLTIGGEVSGRQPVLAPCLGETRGFATGAPSLAWSTKAALLMVDTVRTGVMAYRVVIAPIEVARGRERKEFVQAAVLEFAAKLEQAIVDHPADWQGWLHSSVDEPFAQVSAG